MDYAITADSRAVSNFNSEQLSCCLQHNMSSAENVAPPPYTAAVATSSHLDDAAVPLANSGQMITNILYQYKSVYNIMRNV